MLTLIVAEIAPVVEVQIHVVPRFDNPRGSVFRQFVPEDYRRWTTDKDDEDEGNIIRWRDRGEKTFLLKLPFQTTSGTDLRNAIRQGGDWRPFIPRECWAYFESINGPQRLLSQIELSEVDSQCAPTDSNERQDRRE